MEQVAKNELYEVEIDGDFEVLSHGEAWVGWFEIGIIVAKNNQRFLCHYARITGPDGQTWTGKSRWSLMTAVKSQLQQMVDSGVQLESDDLDEDWKFESASGGYLRSTSHDCSALKP